MGGVEEQPCSKTKKGAKINTVANPRDLNPFFMWVIMYADTDK